MEAKTEMTRINDRELSTLAFHARVLAEAGDPVNPLLERANYLGIAASGLQEFICVRLGSMTARLRRGDAVRPSGMTVSQTLKEAWKRTDILTMQLDRILHEQIMPELSAGGVHIAQPEDVTPVQMASLSSLFHRDLMPALSPVFPDEEGNLPPLSSAQLCLAVLLAGKETGQEELAVIELPSSLPGLVPLVGNERWLMTEDAVRLNLHLVFGDRKIESCSAFKVLRASHAACKSGETDVRLAVKDCMARREKGKILRVVCAPDMPGMMEEKLCAALKVERSLAVRRGYVLDPARVIRALPGKADWEYPRYQGAEEEALCGSDLFAALRERDRLLCHPYDSFRPVIALLEQAATDWDVYAVKMTLYRVSEKSPVVEALAKAAARGVQVDVCVEPRARMDEERNLKLIDYLEFAGCKVHTGLPGVKVHGKAMLIERMERGKPRLYAHLGTGNYNEKTAAKYTDVGLLTADEAVCADAARFFAFLAGEREQPDLQELTAAPQGMRQELVRLIRREMEKAVRGEKCGVRCLLNALTDVEMIGCLTEAARCGVPVDLTVRGACCLAAGVPLETAGVTVRSVVGRYLEHTRAFAFGAEGQEEVYFSSADWMKRSLNRRVELLVPVREPSCRRKLLYLMAAHCREDVRCHLLQGGEYRAHTGDQTTDVQQLLMKAATSRWADA